MTDAETLKRYFERALALAHAAVDEPTAQRIADAQEIGHQVLTLAAQRGPTGTTLADGHVLYAHASRLRAMLQMIEHLEAPSLDWAEPAAASPAIMR